VCLTVDFCIVCVFLYILHFRFLVRFQSRAHLITTALLCIENISTLNDNNNKILVNIFAIIIEPCGVKYVAFSRQCHSNIFKRRRDLFVLHLSKRKDENKTLDKKRV
jgi:hypothetical protein